MMGILKFIRFKEMNNVFGNALNFGKISSEFQIVYLRDVLEDLSLVLDRKIILDDNLDYQEPTLSSKTNTITVSKKGKGRDFKVKNRILIKKGDLVISKMHTQNGLFAFSDTEYHSTSTFIPFALKGNVLKDYIFVVLKPTLARLYKNDSVKRETYKVDEILDLEIPLPDINIQKSLVSAYQEKVKQAKNLENQVNQIDSDIEQYLFEMLGIQIEHTKTESTNFLQFIQFKELQKWSVINTNTITAETVFYSQKYDNKPITDYFFVNPSTNIPKDKEISFIPMANISDEYGEIIDKECKKLQNNYTRFQENDLLWAKITPCMQNGKSAIANDLENGFGFGSTEFHILRTKNSDFDIRLLHLLLRSQRLLTTAMTYFTGSAGQQRVPKTFLENLTLPIPSRDEQIEIINHIHTLKEQQKQAKIQAQILRKQAIAEFEEAIFI